VKMVVQPVKHTNYTNFVYGARQWWGDGNMYDLGQEKIDYRYGPAFAIAMTPWAMLPTELGGVLWVWFNIVIFFVSVRVLAREVLPGPWNVNREAVFLILVLVGSIRMIWSAQVNPLIFSLVAMGAVAARGRRWWLSAFLLAAAVHIKVWPIAAALLMIACWPRKLGWRFALATAAIVLVPFLTKPVSMVSWHYGQWYHAMFGRIMYDRHTYRDAWTVFEVLGWKIDVPSYVVLQLASAGGVLFLCLWQKQRIASTARLLTFLLAMWTAWQLVFGPATERNTFGLIAPMTAWALVTAIQDKRGQAWMVAAFTHTTVLSNGWIERSLENGYPLIHIAHPLGVMMLASWMVFYAWRWQAASVTAADRTAVAGGLAGPA
jgi:alpha-1,2-mannosyltransferase